MKKLVQVANVYVVPQVGTLALPPPVDVAKNVSCDQEHPATLSAAIRRMW
ncbi:MAG: hypothetical protein OEW83_09065 [Acidimicrobiia bacterium]|nr:hypothetical protein [Acidimicrobiia bacterium]